LTKEPKSQTNLLKHGAPPPVRKKKARTWRRRRTKRVGSWDPTSREDLITKHRVEKCGSSVTSKGCSRKRGPLAKEGGDRGGPRRRSLYEILLKVGAEQAGGNGRQEDSLAKLGDQKELVRGARRNSSEGRKTMGGGREGGEKKTTGRGAKPPILRSKKMYKMGPQNLGRKDPAESAQSRGTRKTGKRKLRKKKGEEGGEQKEQNGLKPQTGDLGHNATCVWFNRGEKRKTQKQKVFVGAGGT